MPTAFHAPTVKTQLRDVLESDREFLFGVYASTRADELDAVSWSDAEKQAFLQQQFAAQSVSYSSHYPGAAFQIIVVGGQDAGRLYVHRRNQEIRIMDIALLSPFRRRGIGSQLIAALLREGEASRRAVSIHVEIFNPAMRLYERLGFRVISTQGVYHLMEWHPESGRELASEGQPLSEVAP